MVLRMGQVVVSEYDRESVWSRQLAQRLGSKATHTFISTTPGYSVEATFPQVRRFRTSQRLAQLQDTDRAFAVLDLPSLSITQRAAIVGIADSYIGRYYDIGQILLFGLSGQFIRDGVGTLVCSRLITAAYYHGADTNLFPGHHLDDWFPVGHPRRSNVAALYATPVDLLTSILTVEEFSSSSRVKSVADLFSL